jgi:hypothetical protein
MLHRSITWLLIVAAIVASTLLAAYHSERLLLSIYNVKDMDMDMGLDKDTDRIIILWTHHCHRHRHHQFQRQDHWKSMHVGIEYTDKNGGVWRK